MLDDAYSTTLSCLESRHQLPSQLTSLGGLDFHTLVPRGAPKAPLSLANGVVASSIGLTRQRTVRTGEAGVPTELTTSRARGGRSRGEGGGKSRSTRGSGDALGDLGLLALG